MKKILSVIMCLALVCAMPVLQVYASAGSTPSGVAYEEIESEIEILAEKNEGLYASFATAVFQGDDVLYEGYFGYIDRENKVAADAECVYEWGSVSKLMVWVSVLQLHEQGKLDLEADIREYLPEGFLTKLKYDEPITMLHLMNHNAGWQETNLPIQTAKEKQLISLEEALRALEPAQTFRPGEVTAYSNWGTALAGLIVERISGMDYVAYVREKIIVPLGMEHTAVAADYKDNEWVRSQREKEKSYLIQGLSLGDTTTGEVLGGSDTIKITDEDLGTGIQYISIYPAGSVVGTLQDMVKFGQALTDEDSPLFENKETHELMLSASDFYGDSDIPKVCHGLWCKEYGVRTLGHAGNTTGGSAELIFDPESGLGVAVLTNQQAETIMCQGIPKLIFGGIEQNPIYQNAVITEEYDLSGDYVVSRGLFEGAVKFWPATSYTPIRATEQGTSFSILGEPALKQFGDNLYRLVGSDDFVYLSNTSDGKQVLETYTMTLIMNESVEKESCALTIYAVALLISLILLIVNVIRMILKPEERTFGAWGLLAGELVMLLWGVLSFASLPETISLNMALFLRVFSGVVAMLGMVLMVLSAGIGLKTAITAKGMHLDVRFGYVVQVLCYFYVIGIVLYFRFFDFWT